VKYKNSRMKRMLFIRGFLCLFKLTVIQLCIESVFPDQFFVRSLLDDVSVVHDQDHIGVLNRGQTMHLSMMAAMIRGTKSSSTASSSLNKGAMTHSLRKGFTKGNNVFISEVPR